MKAAVLALLLPSFVGAFGFGKAAVEQDKTPPESRPDWLSGQAPDFPKSAYILGIGESATQEKAADKARSEIAKAFSLSLSAESQSSAKEVSNGANSTYSEGVSEDIRVYTAKVLDGIEIARYWKDASGRSYALAVLNREHSLNIFKDKLVEYDSDSKTLAAGLEKAEGKFARLKTALKLVEIAKARKKINSDLRILSAEGKGIPPPEALGDVLAAARKAISALVIRVRVTGEGSETVSNRLIDRLESYGLNAVEKVPQAQTEDLVIEAKVDADLLPPENLLWYWSKGTLSAKLSYASTGEVFSRFEEPVQHSANEPDSSLDETLQILAAQSARRVYKILTSGALSDD